MNYRAAADEAAGVVNDCRDHGVEAIAVQADVADPAAVVQMFQRVDDQLGPVEVLINNAGIVAPSLPVIDHDADRWIQMFNVNVIGAMVAAREAVRRMSTARGGSGGVIVNVGSAASRLGSPGEYVDYAASKGAIDTFTIGLSQEVAREGIRVNCVRPGLIHTDIHASGGRPDRVEQLKDRIPLGRGGGVDEVVDAIMYLAGDESTYVTGALLDVSGGR